VQTLKFDHNISPINGILLVPAAREIGRFPELTLHLAPRRGDRLIAQQARAVPISPAIDDGKTEPCSPK
jgi:hypothetical protein